MKISPTPLSGAFLIELDHKFDSRGYFARTFCLNEFKNNGLVYNFIQMSTSFNNQKDQIRGMHYQDAPYQETKVVRCTKGAILDVILDLRKASTTYKQWYATTLSDTNGKSLYIPKGFAHGYKTLENNTEIFYMMDEAYNKESAREIKPKNEYFC